MENSTLVPQLVAILAILSSLLFFKEIRDHYSVETTNCQHLCEWQLAKMNETSNILIRACEDKLQRLHDIDMNMAIIREQMHKEMLELFRYEYQAFQRMQTTKIEYTPQLCSEYCTMMAVIKYHDKEDCQSNVTKLLIENQKAVQRHRSFRLQCQKRLKYSLSSADSFDTIHMLSWSSLPPVLFTICTFILTTVLIFVRWHRQRSNGVTAFKRERERIDAEMHKIKECNVSLTSDVGFFKSSLDTHKKTAEKFIADLENQHLELEKCNLHLRNEVRTLEEEKARLERWNGDLFTRLNHSQQTLKASQSECEKLLQKLACKETEIQNAHKYWHELQSEERKAVQKLKEEHYLVVKSMENDALQLSQRYQTDIKKWKDKLTLESEKHAKEQEVLEARWMELEKEIKILRWNFQIDQYLHNMEIEAKKAKVSELEGRITSLLEEGVRAKSYERSRSRRLLLAKQQDQTSNTLQLLNSKLVEVRNELALFQRELDSQEKRYTKELQIVREENDELRIRLELANQCNAELKSTRVHQKAVQPSLHACNGREVSGSTYPAYMRSRTRLRRQRSTIIDSTNRKIQTQPEPSFVQSSAYWPGYQLSDV